ncbi:MAG TPA: trypsin-like peptidase domain-containing protein [Candidatus Eremiobacteraceae bacterium]|nr:trypsin-like peptidase domain-containing protein [Candidatus Eremiobacteraceae bacterium]
MNLLLAAASIAQSVVLIAASTQGGSKTGSGFAISSTASTTRILTAAHVIDGSTSPLVFVGGPRGDHYPATVLQTDKLRDIALLEIQYRGIPTVTLDDALPVSGTAVQALGYPTFASVPANNPQATPQPLPLSQMQLVTVSAKLDGVAEEGESILLNASLTHGDSGGPIVDATSGKLEGMVLGLAAGYGVAQWMTGDGLGISAAAINAFLAQSGPSATPGAPAFNVVFSPNKNTEISNSWTELASSAGFATAAAHKDGGQCTNAAGAATANAVIEERTEEGVFAFIVRDCSGAVYYQDYIDMDPGALPNACRLLGRAFLGYIDTHRPEWQTLLRYGIAVDPKQNPYLALMSVGRNPFGQLIVTHIFRDGPADRAGLHQGDAIVKIDGQPTRALADLYISRLMNQPSVTLVVDRDEKESTVKLTLQRFAQLTADGPIPR